MPLTKSHFEPLIGSDLTVYLDDGTPFPLRLERLTPHPETARPAPADDGSDPDKGFTLDLVGPKDPVIQPLTYPVVAGDADPLYLFVSPHAQDDSATYYNIVVN